MPNLEPMTKHYERVFKWELTHPLEHEAFLVGMLFGIFESRYKLFHATRRGGNSVEMPGILLSEALLTRLEQNYRREVNRKCKYLFSIIKARMEDVEEFKMRHVFIRHTEKIYKHKWKEEIEMEG